MTKPHWTLRVVSDQSRTESIDVMKDTERCDQIKAMKKAWELAEPGRHAKVTQRFRALGFLVNTAHVWPWPIFTYNDEINNKMSLVL